MSDDMMDRLRVGLDDFEPHGTSWGERYPTILKNITTDFPSIQLPGWPLLNDLTGGFRMREFSILCGATGAGKTSLLASWAKAFILAGKRCFIMSVETGPDDFMQRTMGAFVGKDLNSGRAISMESAKVMHQQYGQIFSSDALFLSLFDSRVPHERALKEILWYREKKNCEVVFIDNLNFLLEVVSANRQLEVMDNVVHDFIMLCKRLDVHVVMVMHPKKTEHGRVESEFDIKGSSTAVQEAHNIFLFNRPTKADLASNKRGRYARELTVKKLRRRGESVDRSLWLKYGGATYEESDVANTV